MPNYAKRTDPWSLWSKTFGCPSLKLLPVSFSDDRARSAILAFKSCEMPLSFEIPVWPRKRNIWNCKTREKSGSVCLGSPTRKPFRLRARTHRLSMHTSKPSCIAPRWSGDLSARSRRISRLPRLYLARRHAIFSYILSDRPSEIPNTIVTSSMTWREHLETWTLDCRTRASMDAPYHLALSCSWSRGRDGLCCIELTASARLYCTSVQSSRMRLIPYRWRSCPSSADLHPASQPISSRKKQNVQGFPACQPAAVLDRGSHFRPFTQQLACRGTS